MLRGGYIVLCDRYVFTSYARDGVRGCDPKWLRSNYGFARAAGLTLYFRLPLETALGRILQGRPRLKWFEAGMDLGPLARHQRELPDLPGTCHARSTTG